MIERKGILTPEIIIARNLKAGSEQAKDMLFRKHYDTFYKVAFRILKNKPDAEDVVSESFIRVFNRIHQLKDDAQLISWCTSLIIRLSYNFLRTKRYESDLELFDPAVFEDFAARLDLYLVEKTLGRLPSGYRTVIKLHCLDGLDSMEIGQKLKIEPATVRSQLYKGRKKLRLLLGYEY